MSKIASQKFFHELLDSVDVKINGERPWDLKIYNDELFPRVIKQGSLGFGEAYMDDWFKVDRLDMFFERVLRMNLEEKIKIPFSFYFKVATSKLINYQSKKRAKDVAHKHYNLGNDLFTAMLDKRLIYSCGYWKEAQDLETAQEHKLDLICRKLQLQPGMRVLDIGCGWGGLAKFAAEKYGVNVVGVTISEQQSTYAKAYCKGLPIDIRLQDYRDMHETFDRVVSVGMFEHVGHPNYSTYFQAAHRALKDDGLFLLHTIGVNETRTFADEWITKYIFPNGMLPSCAQIAKACEKFFVMEDWHNFGAYYDKTLMAWHDNFVQHWSELKQNYDDKFFRMWSYYLLASAGAFRARTMQLWQIVYSKKGLPGGYIAAR